MSSMICSVCDDRCFHDHSYLGHVICFLCYTRQIGKYLFDKYPEELSEEEEEEVCDFVCDNPHV